MASIDLNKLPLRDVLFFEFGILKNHKPLRMDLSEQYIHPAVDNVDRAVDDLL